MCLCSGRSNCVYSYLVGIFLLQSMASNPDFEEMTVMDLTTWLGQQVIPSEFCEIFSGVYAYFKGIAYFKANCALDNYIDGKEFTKLTEAEVK